MGRISGMVNLSGEELPPELIALHGKAMRYDNDTPAITESANRAVAFDGSSSARSNALPSEDGECRMDYYCICDAIIDNKEELIDIYKSKIQQIEISDAELITLVYKSEGISAFDRIIGDYTAAIWRSDLQELTLIRDHIGSRPIVWHQDGNIIRFASSASYINATMNGQLEIDDMRVAEHLLSPISPRPGGFFKNIESVPPGTICTFSKSRYTSRKFWSAHTKRTVRLNSKLDYFDEFRRLTEVAVSDRLRGTSPTGSHISGGIDSTIVTRIAARAAEKRDGKLAAAFAWAPAASADYPETSNSDERHRIQTICDEAGVPVVFNKEQNTGFSLLLDRPIEYEGIADLADEFAVLQNASEAGVSVMLSGWGGDEAFSAVGSGLTSHLLMRGKLRRSIRRISGAAGGLRNLKAALRFAWRDLVGPLLPDAIYRATNSENGVFRDGCFIASALRAKFSRSPAASALLMRPAAHPVETMARLIEAGHIAERMQTWAHWGAEYGIQYRYPLTDRRLLEFILGCPVDVLFTNDQPRALSRIAFNDLLPPGTGKSDPANEARRYSEMIGSWQTIAAAVSDRDRYSSCPWLETAKLRERIERGPSADKTQNVIDFANILVAMRVWNMYIRTEKRRNSNTS